MPRQRSCAVFVDVLQVCAGSARHRLVIAIWLPSMSLIVQDGVLHAWFSCKGQRTAAHMLCLCKHLVWLHLTVPVIKYCTRRHDLPVHEDDEN